MGPATTPGTGPGGHRPWRWRTRCRWRDRTGQAGGAGRAASGRGRGRAAAGGPRTGQARAGRAGRGRRRHADGRRPDRPGAPGARPPGAQGLGGDQVEGRQAVRELLERRPAAGQIPAPWPRAWTRPHPRRDRGPGRRRRVQGGLLSADGGSTPWPGPTPPRGWWPWPGRSRSTARESLCGPRDRGRVPFLLVLDGITDPHNLGALLRSAECAGVTGVVLPRHRSAHLSPTVAKAAAGAIEYLPMALVAGRPRGPGRLAARRLDGRPGRGAPPTALRAGPGTAGGAGPRGGGHGAGRTDPEAVRRTGGHPPARCAVVAQRARGRRRSPASRWPASGARVWVGGGPSAGTSRHRLEAICPDRTPA